MRKIILLGLALLVTACVPKKMITETKVSLTVTETDRAGGVLKDYGTVVELWGEAECDDVVAEIEQQLDEAYAPERWKRGYWNLQGSDNKLNSANRTGLYSLKYPAAVTGWNYKSAEIICDGATFKYWPHY